MNLLLPGSDIQVLDHNSPKVSGWKGWLKKDSLHAGEHS